MPAMHPGICILRYKTIPSYQIELKIIHPILDLQFLTGKNSLKKSEGIQAVPDLSILRSINETSIKNDYSFVVSIRSDQYKIISWKKVSGP